MSRAGSSLFLVRAVFLNRDTGGFTVTPVWSDLLVEHGSLGRSAVPMKRQALIVRLPQKPETVFVSCSMAKCMTLLVNRAQSRSIRWPLSKVVDEHVDPHKKLPMRGVLCQYSTDPWPIKSWEQTTGL